VKLLVHQRNGLSSAAPRIKRPESRVTNQLVPGTNKQSTHARQLEQRLRLFARLDERFLDVYVCPGEQRLPRGLEVRAAGVQMCARSGFACSSTSATVAYARVAARRAKACAAAPRTSCTPTTVNAVETRRSALRWWPAIWPAR